jgi:hypothetical protein
VPLGWYSKNARPGCLTLQQARDLVCRRVATALEAPLEPYPATGVALAVPLAGASLAPTSPLSAGFDAVGNPAPEPAADISLLALCRAYVDDMKLRGKVSAKACGFMVERHIAPSAFAHKPASELTDIEVGLILTPIVVEKNQKVEANHLRALLMAAFNKAKSTKITTGDPFNWRVFKVTTNPVDNVNAAPNAKKKRERNLSFEEVGKLWRLLNSDWERNQPPNVQLAWRFLRLDLLLGGQRCEQLLRVEVGGVSLEKNEITLWDGKGLRPVPRKHTLPLVPTAIREVKCLLELAKDRDSKYLFSSRIDGKTLTSGPVMQAVSDISKMLEEQGVPSFEYGDLRRTTQNRFQEWDVADRTVQQILSHGLSGVEEAHYNVFEFLKMKLEVLQRWEAHLNSYL